MGHIGLMPQQVQTAGGYRSVGHSEHETSKIRRDAHAVGGSGAFAVVIEGTVEPLAREVTAAMHVPTIGIGASSACDGQVLVSDDILGLFNDFTPRFVKRYDELGKGFRPPLPLTPKRSDRDSFRQPSIRSNGDLEVRPVHHRAAYCSRMLSADRRTASETCWSCLAMGVEWRQIMPIVRDGRGD